MECVSCYAKGVGYEPGQRLTKTDHEYNVIKLDNKWYPIDSTWGAGHIKDRRFVKEYNEFYDKIEWFYCNESETKVMTGYHDVIEWCLNNNYYPLLLFFS